MLAALLASCLSGGVYAEGITIRSTFAGGNVLVRGIEGNTVQIGPDLRGDRPWFYWYFEVEVAQPGRVTFVFPVDAGAQIGMNGPAFSLDQGKTWAWLGMDNTQFLTPGRRDPTAPGDTFFFNFTPQNKRVRFSVGIPYLQSDLAVFANKVGAHPNLAIRVLTKSRGGKPVTVWQVGQPAPGKVPVLFSARHHACEAIASYVLEGFIEEALADSPAGSAFREKYVLYAIPIVDVDGVEAGDQGKGRLPHDHNRDYGQDTMIYPSVIALVELAREKKIELALDFHCPTLRMDIHQGVYFAGIKRPHIEYNLDELIAWLDEERPPAVTGRERIMMSKPGPSAPTGGMPFSNYFAYQAGVNFAATIEIPFTQRPNDFDAALAREYGRGLLRAWTRTIFVSDTPDSARSERASARFLTFRKNFLDVYMKDPAAAEALANTYLSHAQAPVIYRIEASNLMGMLSLRQRKYADACDYYQIAMTHVNATASQRSVAASQRVLAICALPETSISDIDQALHDFSEVSYPSPIQASAVYSAAATAYEQRNELDKALSAAKKWFPVSGKYDKGKALNRVAGLQDKLGNKQDAIQTRLQAVAILRKALDPVPVGVFGPSMAVDLFDALSGIPTATREEKMAAALIVRDHHVSPKHLKERISTEIMDSLPPKEQ